MRQSIRLLHLSDFHFNEGRKWDRDPLLTRLTQLLADETEAGRKIHLVLVTGDLANAGTTEEYAPARAFFQEKLLPALGNLKPSRCYFVPGNHDVDRKMVNRSAIGLQKVLLAGGDDRDVADALNGDGKELMLKPFDAYHGVK